MQELFWQRWSRDYLNILQTSSKWNTEQPSVQINDLVLLKENLLPPAKWKLARVQEIHPGTDGLVRVVTVRTANSKFKRPISQLCRLPLSANATPQISK